MADKLTLSASTRTNLLSLQRTTSMISKTQERLASGKKVNSALDDALSYFKARSLNNRSSDLQTTKDGIVQAVNVVKAATEALDSVERVMQQMKAIAESAKSSSDSTVRQSYASQFNTLRSQIDTISQDASYNGVNLLRSGPDTLVVKFNERGTNTLEIRGMDTTVSTNGVNVMSAGTTAASGSTGGGSWANSTLTDGAAAIDSVVAYIDSALLEVRSNAETFGTNAAMLDIRKEFTENLVNTLQGGASQLVNADLNEESANMLSLQTRQQLGTISLSIAQQSEQAILRLF
ncbi:MAG: flagellin [Alphaproteobacteria bacterium]|nr:flagellin [Alphaproteobacteria bacterium]